MKQLNSIIYDDNKEKKYLCFG